MSEPPDAPSSRLGGIVLGMLIALFVPLSSLTIAWAWDMGTLTLEANGAFVQMLQAAAPLELVVGPLGLVIAGRAARLRTLGWLFLLGIGAPLLAVLWFIGVAYLGGLAGEPF